MPSEAAPIQKSRARLARAPPCRFMTPPWRACGESQAVRSCHTGQVAVKHAAQLPGPGHSQRRIVSTVRHIPRERGPLPATRRWHRPVRTEQACLLSGRIEACTALLSPDFGTGHTEVQMVRARLPPSRPRIVAARQEPRPPDLISSRRARDSHTRRSDRCIARIGQEGSGTSSSRRSGARPPRCGGPCWCTRTLNSGACRTLPRKSCDADVSRHTRDPSLPSVP